MIPNPTTKKDLILRIAIASIFGLFLIGILIANYISGEEKEIGQNIYPNVFIDNQNVGGKTKNQVLKSFSKDNKKFDKIKLTIVFKDSPIATFSAQKLGIKTDINDVVDRAYLIGRVDYLPSRAYQKMATILHFDKFNFATHVVYDKSFIKDYLYQLGQDYNQPAKDALFQFQNGRVTAFKPEENGTKIDADGLQQQIDIYIASLKRKAQSKTLVLKSQTIKPEVTLAESNKFGIEELIGQGQSNYTHSIPGRIHNLSLAAQRINGVLVPKGEEFSFNSSVGEISKLTGYEQAYVIKAGKTVLDDGGGVCQVSTTLFRAALNSGLPITARTAHAYRVGYYENDSQPGFDATVFSPSVDFRFKNDTPGAILIQTEIEPANNVLRFKFYGKKDGRKVYVSPARIWDVTAPPPDVHQDDPTLRKGEVKQVDFAAWGTKAAFDYKVTKGDQVTFQQTFFSNFRPWAAVYLVGTGEF